MLAAMADIDGDRASALDRMCAAGVGLLSLRGAGISLMVDGELRGTAGSLELLQSQRDEGPCVECYCGACRW